MGLGDERLVNAREVSQILRCPICYEVYVDPVFSSGNPCQHVFCEACIGEALHGQNKCPICRLPMQPNHLQPHPIIQNLLDELHVHCEGGCYWTGQQDAYSAHREVCPVQLLATTRQQLNETSEELTSQLAQLKTQLLERDGLLRQSRQKTADLSREVVNLKERNIGLENELEIARDHAEHNATIMFAEMQAKVAAETHEAAKLAADNAKQAVDIARQQAFGSRKTQIFVIDTTGKNLSCKFQYHDTVEILKLAIQETTLTSLESFYLTYGGKRLEDDKYVASYGIAQDATLCMHMRLLPANK